jgi:DNA-binding MarR family transcriptional regulator
MRRRKASDFELGDSVPYLLNRVGFRSFAEFEKHLAAERLTVSMFRIMAVLQGRTAKRIGDLADPTSLEPSTISRAVKALQQVGYVVRERSSLDERVVEVALTDAGQEVLRRLEPIAKALENKVIEDLTPAEVTTLKLLLKRLRIDVGLNEEAFPLNARLA